MGLVEHKVYGKGKILTKRFGGFELYVEFEDGIKRWVRRDEVRLLSDTPILVKQNPPELVLSEEQFKARQIIEALRLGVVPPQYVEEFIFGREGEIKEIKNWLNDPSDGSLAIIGEYGVGKTHLLEYIHSIALNNNWAVSIVELDPNEIPFHKPKVIYHKIISSFRFKSQSGRISDFREFLRSASQQKSKDIGKYCFHEKFKIVNEDAHLVYCPLNDSVIRQEAILCEGCNYLNRAGAFIHTNLRDHNYLGRIVEKIKNGTDDENIWKWIEGEPGNWIEGETNFPRMYERSNANVYCYILSGIGFAARSMVGLNGFLILFDEAESLDFYWYTSYQNDKAWNFLTGMILMANNDKNLLNEEIVHTATGWRGKYTNLQYGGHSRLPFIWKIPCHVKIIFAFAPISGILDKDPLSNLKKIELEHLDNESLMKISEAIVNLYQKAYNFQPNKDQVVKAFDLIPKDKTRLFIKAMIEALDLMRFYPNKSVEELLK